MISPLLICCQVVPRSGHSHVSKGPLRMLFLVMPIRIKGVLGMYSMPSNLNSPLIGVMSVQTVPPSAVWAIVVVCRSDTATRPLFASENDTLVTAGSGVCATSLSGFFGYHLAMENFAGSRTGKSSLDWRGAG